jgi:hypothetical protein
MRATRRNPPHPDSESGHALPEFNVLSTLGARAGGFHLAKGCLHTAAGAQAGNRRLHDLYHVDRAARSLRGG